MESVCAIYDMKRLSLAQDRPSGATGVFEEVRMAEVCRISWGPRDHVVAVLGPGSVGLGYAN